jgi:hypothetical protein
MTLELDGLMLQQIDTLKQHAKISDLELGEYRQRTLQIRILCRALNPGSPQISADYQAA